MQLTLAEIGSGGFAIVIEAIYSPNRKKACSDYVCARTVEIIIFIVPLFCVDVVDEENLIALSVLDCAAADLNHVGDVLIVDVCKCHICYNYDFCCKDNANTLRLQIFYDKSVTY